MYNSDGHHAPDFDFDIDGGRDCSTATDQELLTGPVDIHITP